jgi:UDP-N-acetylglucosamine--N-acetylmuramyl-(pentapeptide) pyrophosphoryl-undecaprenol N-acetylglucosamine transferase
LKKLKIIISGGGTGGHIFPAIAIANALKALHSDIEFLFVGAEGRMEMEKVPAAGFKIEGLWISGLQRKLTLSNLLFPFKVLSSLMKAKKIFVTFQPDVAIGTGGYASGPMLQVAAKNGIPTVIQEQNSYPGITNKILGSKVSKVCVAYDGMERYFPKDKIVLTGNPVRKDITDLRDKRTEALRFFELDENKKVVLVIGGSLGARTINESIEKFLPDIAAANIQLIWQTGKGYFTHAQDAVNKHSGKGLKAFDFISKMDLAYAAADIVISRAGAISLSELAVAGKACILVPSPNVAEDHQTKNAMALVKNDAAIMVKDIESREKLGKELIALVNNGSQQKQLQDNIKKMARPDAAEKIALEILKLIEIKK